MFLALEKSPAGSRFALDALGPHIPWNEQGLIAAVAQQHDTGEVLMLAWPFESLPAAPSRPALDLCVGRGPWRFSLHRSPPR